LGITLGPPGVCALAPEVGEVGKDQDTSHDEHVDGGALTHESGPPQQPVGER
jgi:hypothetical protein